MVVAAYFAAIMAVSIKVHNQSIVDIFWGPGFALVAAVSYLASRHGGGDDARRIVVLVLTAMWGLLPASAATQLSLFSPRQRRRSSSRAS